MAFWTAVIQQIKKELMKGCIKEKFLKMSQVFVFKLSIISFYYRKRRTHSLVHSSLLERQQVFDSSQYHKYILEFFFFCFCLPLNVYYGFQLFKTLVEILYFFHFFSLSFLCFFKTTSYWLFTKKSRIQRKPGPGLQSE